MVQNFIVQVLASLLAIQMKRHMLWNSHKIRIKMQKVKQLIES
jgi:hypothetical protein